MSDKVIHKAKHINEKGHVSPLCANKPKKINLARESWTNRAAAVTCKKCLNKLKESENDTKSA